MNALKSVARTQRVNQPIRDVHMGNTRQMRLVTYSNLETVLTYRIYAGPAAQTMIEHSLGIVSTSRVCC